MSLEFREKVQAEAINALLSARYGSIDVSMRLGKSLIGLRIASYFNNILVSYPNIPVKRAWLSDAEKFGIDISHITFTTHISLPKYDLSQYDCIILDEIDQVSIRVFEYILSNKPSRIHGMSGTFPVKGDKVYFINRLCPIVYVKKLDETIGLTSKDYLIKVHLIEPDKTKNIELKSGAKWSEYDKIKFFDSKYESTKNFSMMIQLMQAIAFSKTKYNYAIKLANKMERGLLFLETIAQCNETGFPTYHSKNKESDNNLALFQSEEINKLATVLQLKAGQSFPKLKEAILVHSYSSNNRSAQRIGRTLQFVEGETSTIHVICLDNTRDLKWTTESLKDFNKDKIQWIK